MSICCPELRPVCDASQRPSAAAPARPVRPGAAPGSVASWAGARPSAATPFRPMLLGAGLRPNLQPRRIRRQQSTAHHGGKQHPLHIQCPTRRCLQCSQPVGHSSLSCTGCVCCASPGRSERSPRRDGAFSRLACVFAFAFSFALGCDVSVLHVRAVRQPRLLDRCAMEQHQCVRPRQLARTLRQPRLLDQCASGRRQGYATEPAAAPALRPQSATHHGDKQPPPHIQCPTRRCLQGSQLVGHSSLSYIGCVCCASVGRPRGTVLSEMALSPACPSPSPSPSTSPWAVTCLHRCPQHWRQALFELRKATEPGPPGLADWTLWPQQLQEVTSATQDTVRSWRLTLRVPCHRP